MLANLLKW